eukprot:scaffold481_cov238-Pinguiococcus_pyrenoidosus.AAC.3
MSETESGGSLRTLRGCGLRQFSNSAISSLAQSQTQTQTQTRTRMRAGAGAGVSGLRAAIPRGPGRDHQDPLRRGGGNDGEGSAGLHLAGSENARHQGDRDD